MQGLYFSGKAGPVLGYLSRGRAIFPSVENRARLLGLTLTDFSLAGEPCPFGLCTPRSKSVHATRWIVIVGLFILVVSSQQRGMRGNMFNKFFTLLKIKKKDNVIYEKSLIAVKNRISWLSDSLRKKIIPH